MPLYVLKITKMHRMHFKNYKILTLLNVEKKFMLIGHKKKKIDKNY